jgi:hypothetical protein
MGKEKTCINCKHYQYDGEDEVCNFSPSEELRTKLPPYLFDDFCCDINDEKYPNCPVYEEVPTWQ